MHGFSPPGIEEKAGERANDDDVSCPPPLLRIHGPPNSGSQEQLLSGSTIPNLDDRVETKHRYLINFIPITSTLRSSIGDPAAQLDSDMNARQRQVSGLSTS